MCKKTQETEIPQTPPVYVGAARGGHYAEYVVQQRWSKDGEHVFYSPDVGTSEPHSARGQLYKTEMCYANNFISPLYNKIS